MRKAMTMNNDTKPIHYVLYARKSSESEDRQVLSIDSQIDELKALAVRSEFTIAETRFEAHSAKAPGRPVFNLMLDDIEHGKVDGIVVWHPDRLSRNSMDTGRLIYLFDLGKLREIVTPGQIFRNTPNDKFLLNLLCSQAKLENDNKSINIKRGLKAKADRGIYPAPAPVGYLNDRATERGSRIIRKDPERFDLVRRIFDTMLEGIYAPLQIMRIANEQWGFTMPNGKKLSRSTIYVILTRPFYCGRFEYPVGSGIWHKGIHEPIITESEYDRIQRMLGRAGKPRPQTHYFAFTAMINCAECGAYITAEEKTKHQKNGNVHHYTYYRCTKRKGLPCSQMPITEKKLADQIEEKLHTIDLPKGFKTWGVRWLEKTDQQTTGYTAEALASYEKTLKQSEEKIDALIDMRAVQEITQDEFLRRRAVATAEKHRIEGLIANMEERKKKWLMKADEILDFATAAPKKFVEGDIETRKKMFRKLGSNLLLNNKILTISMGKPFVPLKIIAAEVKSIHKRLEPPETSDKSEDYERLYTQNPVVLRGQDSDLLRKLMGLPGKPFPTLPRYRRAPNVKLSLGNYTLLWRALSKNVAQRYRAASKSLALWKNIFYDENSCFTIARPRSKKYFSRGE
jgi:site-specific DNA recombinase